MLSATAYIDLNGAAVSSPATTARAMELRADGASYKDVATGEADADPNIPYEGSAVSPSSAVAAAPSESSTEYAGGGQVPERVTVNITVQARPV